MNAPVDATPGFYRPGCAKRKLAMALCGLLLAALGASQLAEPLGLLAFGKRARAEATAVIKAKDGLADLVLTDDAQIQAALEPHDRSYIYWNEFRFQTPDGRTVNVRAPVGSQLKPLYPLLDADGLPTTELVCYDPAQPERVAFPLIISTWFAPSMLAIIGLGCAIIGFTLFYWANRPIELPHIPSASATPAPRPPGA